MGVVAAGVHNAVGLRTIGDVVQLLNRQGVYVRPEGDRMIAGLFALQNACNIGLSHPVVGNVPFIQFCFNECGGSHLIQSQLRVGVQLPAAGGQFWKQRLGTVKKFTHRAPFFPR